MNVLRTLPVVFVVLGGAAQATPLDEMTVEHLQKAWLQCDRLASDGLVELGAAAACSMVHEQLLRRGFGGDFRQMLTWWQGQRSASVPPRPAAAARQP